MFVLLKSFSKGHILASPGKRVAAPEFTNTEGFALHSHRATAVVCLPEKPPMETENECWADLEGCP